MSNREDMVALADRVSSIPVSWLPGPGPDGENVTNITFTLPERDMIVTALRSTARTGPDVADNGILNAAKFVAWQDREMLAQMLFALHERPDSPSPVRFNCSWSQLKSFNRASFYKCADDIRAIAAIPAPATAAAGWQDIETAPKDTPIWAWGDNWHWREGSIGFLHSDYIGHKGVVCFGGRAGPPFSIGSDNAPTHWMPLPAAPTERSAT